MEYVGDPQTLAEHLKKRRLIAGKLQRDVAAEVGVKVDTYQLWEKGGGRPSVGVYPGIIRFLGYDPVPEGTTLPERLKRKRWQLGLTTKQAAALIGVNESTFLRWESGQGQPANHGPEVEQFLRSAVRITDAPRPTASHPGEAQ